MEALHVVEAGRVLAELVDAIERGELDASPAVLGGMVGGRSILFDLEPVR